MYNKAVFFPIGISLLAKDVREERLNKPVHLPTRVLSVNGEDMTKILQ